MMYSNKLAFAVKANGKILREFDKDKVYIPFGSEYSLLIKNLNSVKAVVNISIDDKSVDDNKGGFIVPPKGEIDIERFVKDMNKGNRFKFIERTGKIEQHRGVKIDDGLIHVEFQFEKPLPEIQYVDHYVKHVYHDYFYHDPYWHRPRCTWNSGNVGSTLTTSNSAKGISGSSLRGMTFNASSGGEAHDGIACAAGSTQTMNFMSQVNDVGITVPGSESKQQFTVGYVGQLLDTKHSMVIHLLGETSQGKTVSKPVTVKSKPICSSCGHQNKASAKFCSECGTALEII